MNASLTGAPDVHAEDEIAVAGEVLGGARHREVGAELERVLAQRAGERVVDGDERLVRAGLRGQGGHVEHVEAGIRR